VASRGGNTSGHTDQTEARKKATGGLDKFPVEKKGRNKLGRDRKESNWAGRSIGGDRSRFCVLAKRKTFPANRPDRGTCLEMSNKDGGPLSCP